MDSAPGSVGLNAHTFDLAASGPGIKRRVGFLVAETADFVDDDARGQVAGVAILVEPDAAGHHGPHLVASEVGVVEVGSCTDVVGNEVHAAPIGVEDLGAAGHEPVGGAASDGVGKSDVGDIDVVVAV